MRLVPRLPALRGIAELIEPPLLQLLSSLEVRSEPASSLRPDRKVEALVVRDLDAAGEPRRPPARSRGRSGRPVPTPLPSAPCSPLLATGPMCAGAEGLASSLAADRPCSARLRRLRCLDRERHVALASLPCSLSAAARSAQTTAAGPASALAAPPAAAAGCRPPQPPSLRPSTCRAGLRDSAGWLISLAGRPPGRAGACGAVPSRPPLLRSAWPQRPRPPDRLRVRPLLPSLLRGLPRRLWPAAGVATSPPRRSPLHLRAWSPRPSVGPPWPRAVPPSCSRGRLRPRAVLRRWCGLRSVPSLRRCRLALPW